MLLKRPDLVSLFKFVSLSTFSATTTYYLMNPREKKLMNEKNLLVATGCDSGLGYSIAVHCHENLKMSVLACVHHKRSKGAEKLKNMFGNSNRFRMVELEITRDDSINELKSFIEELLEEINDLELTALVNNCGMMIFGEAEWQTNEQIEQQINVNLIGTIKLTRAMLPLARKYKSRIINVSSHCALRALPALSIYGATKAGICLFTDALRIEMKEYGVNVVNFIPGSFVESSNIASNQLQHAADMRQNFNEEQRNFYGEYFERFNSYLSGLSGAKEPHVLQDKNIIRTFEEALLDNPPKSVYSCEPWRYKVYHFLFKIAPANLGDWLVKRFVNFPRFDPSKAIKNS